MRLGAEEKLAKENMEVTGDLMGFGGVIGSVCSGQRETGRRAIETWNKASSVKMGSNACVCLVRIIHREELSGQSEISSP